MIATVNDWPGPLVKDLQRQNPSLQILPLDAVYCVEIHVDNYAAEMPVLIREALQRREEKIRSQRGPNPKPAKARSKKQKKK